MLYNLFDKPYKLFDERYSTNKYYDELRFFKKNGMDINNQFFWNLY